MTPFNSSISVSFCWKSSVAFLKDEFDYFSSSCSFSITLWYVSSRDRVFNRTMPSSACCLALIAMLARLVTAATRSFTLLNCCLRSAATLSDFFSFNLFFETAAVTFCFLPRTFLSFPSQLISLYKFSFGTLLLFRGFPSQTWHDSSLYLLSDYKLP